MTMAHTQRVIESMKCRLMQMDPTSSEWEQLAQERRKALMYLASLDEAAYAILFGAEPTGHGD